jgi:hypothetical protein
LSGCFGNCHSPIETLLRFKDRDVLSVGFMNRHVSLLTAHSAPGATQLKLFRDGLDADKNGEVPYKEVLDALKAYAHLTTRAHVAHSTRLVKLLLVELAGDLQAVRTLLHPSQTSHS